MNYSTRTTKTNNEMFVNYPDVLELKDLTKMLHIGRNTALKLLSNQEIKNFRIGRTYKIPKISVIDYVNSKI